MLLSKIKRNKRHAEYNRYMNHCQWEELRDKYGLKVAIGGAIGFALLFPPLTIAIPDNEMVKWLVSGLIVIGGTYFAARGHKKIGEKLADRKLAKMNITPPYGAKSFEELEKELEEERKLNK